MAVYSRYITPERLAREGLYRRRLAWALAGALVFHVGLIALVTPLRDEIPLVRRIGYRGELRILPEISVMRETAEAESEIETSAGLLSGRGFRVVSLEIVEWVVPPEGPAETPSESPEADQGEDLLSQLETSLPQPLSSDMVIEKLVEPVYPLSSIEAGVEGVATFRLHVAKTGEVRRAWLLDSDVDDACNMEAYLAVIQWEFSPYLIGGEPAAILVDQRIRFRLRSGLRDAVGEQSGGAPAPAHVLDTGRPGGGH